MEASAAAAVGHDASRSPIGASADRLWMQATATADPAESSGLPSLALALAQVGKTPKKDASGDGKRSRDGAHLWVAERWSPGVDFGALAGKLASSTPMPGLGRPAHNRGCSKHNVAAAAAAAAVEPTLAAAAPTAVAVVGGCGCGCRTDEPSRCEGCGCPGSGAAARRLGTLCISSTKKLHTHAGVHARTHKLNPRPTFSGARLYKS
jgi:hypothetical protein